MQAYSTDDISRIHFLEENVDLPVDGQEISSETSFHEEVIYFSN